MEGFMENIAWSTADQVEHQKARSLGSEVMAIAPCASRNSQQPGHGIGHHEEKDGPRRSKKCSNGDLASEEDPMSARWMQVHGLPSAASKTLIFMDVDHKKDSL
ncbi:unnamed protein product [Calypogeia fissa]